MYARRIYSTLLLLLSGLARGLAAGREHVKQGGTGDSGSSVPGRVTRDFWDAFCTLNDLATELAGGCVWGQNCGGGCAQYANYGIESSNDKLDEACLEHDKCLCAAESISEMNACDDDLVVIADRIAEEYDNCQGLWNLNPFCTSDPISCAAWNVARAIAQKSTIGFGKNVEVNCNCINHQNKASCGSNDDYYDNTDYNMDYDYMPDYDEPEPKPEPEPEPLRDLLKFNLEMDWNPSSCYVNSECKESKQINGFTISEMTAKLEEKGAKNIRCMNKNSQGAKDLRVTDQLSKGTLRALECIYENSAGENEEMWKNLYVNVGSCTGLSVSEYFDTIVKLYDKVNVNKIIYDMGITDGKSVVQDKVDRDALLDAVSDAVGKKAWIECDPDLMMLRVVLVCVDPEPPYDIIDCTMDTKDPTSTNGIPCDGKLKLPTISDGGYVSEKCQDYIPYGVSKSGVVEAEAEPSPDADESSSPSLCPTGTEFVSSVGKCAETSNGCSPGYKWDGSQCRIPSGGMITYDTLYPIESPPPPPGSDIDQQLVQASETHALPVIKSFVFTIMMTIFFAAML